MLKVNRSWIITLVFIPALVLIYVALGKSAIAATIDDDLAELYKSKKYSHLVDILSTGKKEHWSLEKGYVLFKAYSQLGDYKRSKRILGYIEDNLPPLFENLLFYEKLNLLKNSGRKKEILNTLAGLKKEHISPFLLNYISSLLISEFKTYKDRPLLLRSLERLVPIAETTDSGSEILRLYANTLNYSDEKKGEALLKLWKSDDINKLSLYEKSIEKAVKKDVNGFADEILTHFSSQGRYKNYTYNIKNIPKYLALTADKSSPFFTELRKIYFRSMIKKRKYSILINDLSQRKKRKALGMNESEAYLAQFNLMLRKGNVKSATALINKIIKKHPQQNLDKQYLALGKYYFRKGYYEQALYFFQRLSSVDKELYEVSDVKWHLWRSHLALENKEELEKLANWAYGYKFENKELGARFCYWGYKLNLYRDGDLFRCYKQFPLTYYGLHSKYKTNQLISATAVSIPASQVFSAAGNISATQERQLKFLRFIYLLDEEELADSLVRDLLGSTDSNMMLSLANILLELERYYLVQIIVESNFRPVLEKNKTGRRLLLPYFFPLAYDEEISRLEEKGTVPKTLILSVMREESHFNPEIKSVAGAVGLMQLMPGTAKYVGKKIGIKVKPDSLVDPEINLKLGSAYLKQLMKRYKGNVFYTLAAYNGGPTNVRRWIKKTKSNDNDEFVESITFMETQNYVRRVMRTFYIYRDMYENI